VSRRARRARPPKGLSKYRIGINPSIAEEVREALMEVGFNDAEES
jgi:hypothetical protein